MNDASSKHAPEAVEAFIDRWTDTGGKETAGALGVRRECGRVLEFLALPGFVWAERFG